MPVDVEQFLHAIAMLADKENILFTVKQSGKGAIVCGSMCFVGGLLGGPIGMAVGGTLGGLTAYRMTGGEYRLTLGLNKHFIFLFFLVMSLEIIIFLILNRFSIG